MGSWYVRIPHTRLRVLSRCRRYNRTVTLRLKGRLNTDTSPQNFWITFLENDLTEELNKSTVANAITIPLLLCFSCFILLRWFRKKLTKLFYFYLSRTCGSLSGTPSVISLALILAIKSMWNAIECKRDSYSGAFGGARKTHWELVSHALKKRLNTIKNHMSATEAASLSSRKCEREDVAPPRNYDSIFFTTLNLFWGPLNIEKVLSTRRFFELLCSTNFVPVKLKLKR